MLPQRENSRFPDPFPTARGFNICAMQQHLNQKLIISTDGGSRGNPGPAAIGVVISVPGKTEKEYGEYIGKATNNQAEYRAVVFGLKKAKQLLGGDAAEKVEIEVRLDSELIARQLGREYKIKEDELKLLFVEVWNLTLDFGRVDFVHVPREKNRHADTLVNEALDRAS